MPTRFYLSLNVAAAVTPVIGAWQDVVDRLDRKLLWAKDAAEALGLGTRIGWTAGQTALDRVYVSDPLAAGISFSGVTVALQLACREFNAGDNSTSRLRIAIVSEDGQTVRQVLLALGQFGPATEYINNATLRNKTFADGDTVAGTYTTVAGDRLVVEIGHTDTGATPEAQARYGAPSGTNDHAANETETTSLVPWVEFSNTITPAPQTISPTGIASAEEKGTPQFNQNVTPSGIATAEAIGAARPNMEIGHVVYDDDFVRANNPALGFPWSESEEAAAVLQINTFEVRLFDAASYRGVAFVDKVFAANQWAEIQFNTDTTPGAVNFLAGVFVRGAGTWDNFTGYVVAFEWSAGALVGFKLKKFVNEVVSAGSVLADLPRTISFADLIALEIVGTRLKVYHNNVEIASIVDAAIASGKAGLFASGTGAASNWVGFTPFGSGDMMAIFSEEAVGIPTLSLAGAQPQNILPTGLPTAEAVGTAQLNLEVSPSGLASAEAVGAPQVQAQVQGVGAIPSAEAIGAVLVANEQDIAPAGIVSAEAIGASALLLTIQVAGIPSSEAVGGATAGAQVQGAGGIPSGEAIGQPQVQGQVRAGGVASAEAVGTATVAVEQDILPTGIVTAEAIGNPSLSKVDITAGGIPSAEVIGNPTVLGEGLILPTGIPSAEAVGTPTFITPQTVLIVGIASAEAIGIPGCYVGEVSSRLKWRRRARGVVFRAVEAHADELRRSLNRVARISSRNRRRL